MNEIGGRSRRVLNFLIKRLISENSPFKGYSINFHFLCVGAILSPSGRVAYSPSPAEIVGSNPTRDMDVYLL